MNLQATEIIEVKKTASSPMLFLDVDPKFVLEVASGLKDPEDVAADYGFSPKQWKELKKYQPFIKLVDDKKAELKLSGFTFRMKAQVLAEDLLDDLALHAKKDDVSFHTVLETAKFAARAAGIDSPIKEEDGKAGNSFSININLGAGKSVNIDVNTENQQKPVENRPKRQEKEVFEVEVGVDFEEERAVIDSIPYESDRFFKAFSPDFPCR